MKPHEWLLMAVEIAVIVVSLLHIYLELHKRKESRPIRIIFWRFESVSDVKEKEAKNAEK